MKSKDSNAGVLSDHKKVGNKLIPPFKYMINMQELSFVDNTLPCLLWISAIFLREQDSKAINCTIEFLKKCQEILGDESVPPLAFANNFDKLSLHQKNSIVSGIKDTEFLEFIRENIKHQHALIDGHPFAFLFDGYVVGEAREESIQKLKEDVASLLDRYSVHATKVQTTVFVSMMATGKLLMSPTIDLPNFDCIFTDAESDEARLVGSFVRASINAGHGFGDTEGGSNDWSNSFWKQAFSLEKCNL